ncbi:STAS domain-containing protein [Actinoplanes sp. NEAU-A12]|uniref:STAS domain-containing protein n=1 Tax=Actinoplanes sandaracinus TaxID=3045177 RepID=A0ABT6WZF5_9ACTN|nr:STAS domain-containing protein [Actinoplanes sandaracinus]MDI6105136.1 STAS domain-containing protein [Actinoplanes sandaracinus]
MSTGVLSVDRGFEVVDGCEVVWSAGQIAVSGEIDVGNAEVIGERIRALLGPPVVTVDCAAVTFLDVAGMRMLARVGAAAAAVNTTVRLRRSPSVAETFALCNVDALPGIVMDPGPTAGQDGLGRPEDSR